SRRAYSCSSQTTSMPASANAWLKAGRCPSRSVSARTPSQSKIRAGTSRSWGGRVEALGLAGRAEDADVALGHLLDRRAHVGQQLRRVVLAGVGVEVLAVRVDERDLERGRDVHLGAPARDQVGELLFGEARAAVEDHR